MKRIAVLILSIALISGFQHSYAQTVKLEMADKYFKNFQFDEAIEMYKKALEKKPDSYHAMVRIATSYRLTGRIDKAEDWYKKAIQAEGVQSLDLYYYAQALQFNGKYIPAKGYYNLYAEKEPEDKRGKRLALGIALIPDFMKDSLQFKLYNLAINSKAADFSPAWCDSTLVFVSSRGDGPIENWSENPFLDLYQTTLTKEGEMEPVELQGKVNKFFHEGPATFTPDGLKMYFTRNNYKGKWKTDQGENEGIIKLTIFEATYNDSAWVDLKEMPFADDEYSFAYPTLSADGQHLFFSSDMPDSNAIGGDDLYIVELDSTGKWGKPVNLGPGINTRGNEVFPFIHWDGTLYFSSDSYEGLGGLDVYRSSKKSDGTWGNVENLSYPLNTNADDFGIIFSKDKSAGYISSNRDGGSGDDDIYRFDAKSLNIKALIVDKKTKEPIDSATVYLVKEGDSLMYKLSNTDGRVNYMVEVKKEYTLKVAKRSYYSKDLVINTTGMDNSSPEFIIELERGPLNLLANVIDQNSRGILSEAMVVITNLTDNIIDTLYTDTLGEINYALEYDKDYNIIADKHGYFLAADVNFTTKGADMGTIKKTIPLIRIATGTIIKLENIYYDYDKYDIRPDAAIELNRLVDLMKKYPDMEIELRSHTDSRGSDSYNRKLSQKRAESAVDYIISEGINKKLIKAKGYGETVLVNKCSNNVKCTEEEHQLNRRTEFKVLKQPESIDIKGTIE